MEVTDRPLLALVPVLAAALAIVIVAILQGDDAVAIALPSFLTVLPLLRRGPDGLLAGGRDAGDHRQSPSTSSAGSTCCPQRCSWPGVGGRVLRNAGFAGAALAGCLLLAGCGTSEQPAPSTAPVTVPAAAAHALRPGAAERACRRPGPRHGRRGAARRGSAGRPGRAACGSSCVRSTTAAPRRPPIPRAAPRNAATAAADPDALAVIGTYEQACSESALKVLRPAGHPARVAASTPPPSLPGALRLAPTLGDQGGAAAQLARALGATRIAVVSQRPGAAAAFQVGLAAEAHATASARSSSSMPRRSRRADIVAQLQDEHIQLVALAGSPGRVGDEAPARAGAAARGRAPRGRRAADVRHARVCRRRGTGAAEGVRVISRFVPAEQLGGSARSFAQAYADLHGRAAAGGRLRRRCRRARCSTRRARQAPRGPR